MFSKEQIDLICPFHNRTSCNDAFLNNKEWDYKQHLPRCARCFLLGCLETGYWPEEIKIIPKTELEFVTKTCPTCGLDQVEPY